MMQNKGIIMNYQMNGESTYIFVDCRFDQTFLTSAPFRVVQGDRHIGSRWSADEDGWWSHLPTERFFALHLGHADEM